MALDRTNDLNLSDENFTRFCDLIYEVSGIRYAANKKYLLESRLQRRVKERNMTSYEAYYAFLMRDPARQEEFTALFNEITTNETSFFRNMSQLQAFQREVMPEIIKGKGSMRRLKVWSAACSSGEEAYTLAILIREALGAEADRWSVDIEATDISTEMLNKGRGGVYSDYAMRGTPLAYRGAYFDRKDDGSYAVKPEIKKMVHFNFLNFSNESGMRRMRNFDVIFCRNVLIYFDAEAKKRFVEHFSSALATQGFYFIGHSESLHGLSDDFEMLNYRNAQAYRKRDLRDSVAQRLASRPS